MIFIKLNSLIKAYINLKGVTGVSIWSLRRRVGWLMKSDADEYECEYEDDVVCRPNTRHTHRGGCVCGCIGLTVFYAAVS